MDKTLIPKVRSLPAFTFLLEEDPTIVENRDNLDQDSDDMHTGTVTGTKRFSHTRTDV